MQPIQAQVFYRIPLVGGITDYPEFYRENGAQSICCAINKQLLVSIKQNGNGGIHIESRGDLPWGTGLGSSGAFHSALILALAKFKQQNLSKLTIAKLAYELETGIEDNATGKQDAIACLFKGVSRIRYLADDSVTVDQVQIGTEWQKALSKRLLLFDCGVRRRARDSIKDILSRKNRTLLEEIAKLPDLLMRAWQDGNIDFLASALDLQETYRSQLSPSCKSNQTDDYLAIARKCGAGARLTGAGIGCLLCYCREENQPRLRKALGLPEIRFSIAW